MLYQYYIQSPIYQYHGMLYHVIWYAVPCYIHSPSHQYHGMRYHVIFRAHPTNTVVCCTMLYSEPTLPMQWYAVPCYIQSPPYQCSGMLYHVIFRAHPTNTVVCCTILYSEPTLPIPWYAVPCYIAKRHRRSVFVGFRPVIQILSCFGPRMRALVKVFYRGEAEVKYCASARILGPKHDKRFEWPSCQRIIMWMIRTLIMHVD